MSLVIAIAGIADAQVVNCYQDSLTPSGSPPYASIQATLGDTSNYCNPYDCEGLGECHYWGLPSGSNIVYFESVDSGYYHLRIIQDCRYILWDTCGFVPTTSPTAPYLVRIAAIFPHNCAAMVCGSSPIPFTVSCKPHVNHNPLDSLLFDMDICNVLSSVADPVGAGETPTYLTFPYGECVNNFPLPVGKYFEVYADRRRSRIISVQ